MLRIAVVGAGTGRGQRWLSTVRKLSHLYEFCALCEVNEARARENAERWGVHAYYTDILPMLEEQKPDVVLCAIPPDGNHVVTAVAAAYGANVIVEIPIAPTLPIADFMVDKVKRYGVKLEVAENVYRWASEQLKRQIIESGIMGETIHARLWYSTGPYHGFNAIRMLMGSEAERVLGYVGKVSAPLFVDYVGQRLTEQLWESAIIEFANGVVCLYEMPPRGHWGNHWEIEGTEGQLIGDELYLGSGHNRQRFPFQFEYATIEGEQVLENVRVETDPPVVFENPFERYKVSNNDEVARAQILAGFHKAVTEDVEPEYGAMNARRDQELCIAVRESAFRGSVWVELPLIEVTQLEKRMEDAFRKMYGHDPYDVRALSKTAFPRGGVRWTVAGWL